jgi:tetratricopeptide (TPR) repeat protein
MKPERRRNFDEAKMIDACLHRRVLSICLLLVGVLTTSAAIADNGAARSALAHGRCARAGQILQAELAANPHDAEAHLLLCRVFYAEEEAESAVSECNAAVANEPSGDTAALSIATDWLGRALGQQASHANPLSAYKLARQVRATFDRAVQLDPADGPAASDLGDFYVQAPGVAGGSLDKARALAQSMLPRFPARGHRLLGLIDEQLKDLQGADQEFHQEIAAGPAADGYIDFALFLARQHDRDHAVEAVRQALAANPGHGPVQMDAASILIDMKRDPELAEKALRDYIASPNQTDEAPVPRAQWMLGNLLEQAGDKDAARAAYQAALTLAPDYRPAQKALAQL